MTRTSSCPCCLEVVSSATSAFSKCHRCGHKWRHSPIEIVYENLELRNAGPERHKERKIEDRSKLVLSLITPFTRVLEIGCAEGDLAANIRSKMPVFYAGLEVSRDRHQARSRVSELFESPVSQLSGTQTFDLILSFHVLEHIHNLDSELNHWHRLLTNKPQSRILIEVPNGSGHPLVEVDMNNEHIHQFGPASLTHLLRRNGFDILQLTTGNFESPSYSDSLRILVAPTMSQAEKADIFIDSVTGLIPIPFIIWGCGGDFRTYLLPYLMNLKVYAILDSAPMEASFLHLPVQSFCSEHLAYPVLIASIRYEDEIREQLISLGFTNLQIRTLAQLLEASRYHA